MSSITFSRTKNGTTEHVKFTEGQEFELNGIKFRIMAVKPNGKMIIKPM